jgi:hypothetical protein
MALLGEGLDGAKDVVVAANEAVVICELVFAVGRDEGSLIGRVAGVSPDTTLMIVRSVCALSPGLMRSGE